MLNRHFTTIFRPTFWGQIDTDTRKRHNPNPKCRAIADIEKFEDVRINYTWSIDSSRETRRATLKRLWYFDCHCSECTFQNLGSERRENLKTGKEILPNHQRLTHLPKFVKFSPQDFDEQVRLCHFYFWLVVFFLLSIGSPKEIQVLWLWVFRVLVWKPWL